VTIDPRTDVPDAREIRNLWIGVLVPPIVFLIDLEVAYALVPTACSTQNRLPVHLVHLACLLLVLFSWLMVRRCWKASGATWAAEQGGPLGSSRFLAGIGVLMSALFALVILAMWLPSFILDPCQ
jgi:hypothetical protein